MPDVSATNRIVRGLATTYRATFRDESSGAVVDPGVTTVGIVNATGSTIVAAGSPMDGTGATARTYELLSVDTALLDRFVVTLSSATYGNVETTLEIVGRQLFTIPEMRAYSDNALLDTLKYPDAAIIDVRDRITDEFEQICGVSFVPRYDLSTDAGPVRDSSHLLLVKSNGDPALRVTRIRSVETRAVTSTDWTAADTTDLDTTFATMYGDIVRESGTWTSGVENVRVGFEHGYETPPLAIKTAAMVLARYLLVPSNLNSRALTDTGEFGSTILATAGRFGDHYGIPAVDSVLDRYTERVPVIR